MSLGERELYYRTDRHAPEQGPIRPRELELLVKEGTLSPHAEVRRVGTSVWIRVTRYFNLPEPRPAQPRAPESELSGLLHQLLPDAPQESAPQKPARWFCRVHGQEQGPLEVPQLRELVERGELTPLDRVRREGDARWVLADSIDGLFEGMHLGPLVDVEALPGIGVSPQRFSRLGPKAVAVPAESTDTSARAAAPVESAAAVAPSLPIAVPPLMTPVAAAVSASGTASPVAREAPARPAAASPAVRPSAFVPPRPTFSPPPAKRSLGGGRSLSLPDFSNFEHGPLIVGIVAVIAICWLGYSFGFFTAVFEFVKGLFRSVSGGSGDWTDPGW